MTATEPVTELTSANAELVDRLAALHVQIAELTAESEAIKEQIRKLGEGHFTVQGIPAVSITETRRFSPTWVADHLPPELVEQCSEHVVTAHRARHVLPPALYHEAQRPCGKATVRLAG